MKSPAQLTAENQRLQRSVEKQALELDSRNRELEIEAALERVRARAMAMQKSEELRELVFEFYKQIHPFGFAKWGFEIKIAKEDKSGFYCWISPPGARIQPEGFEIPTLDHWVLKKYWSTFEQQTPSVTIEVSGDDKRKLGVLLLEQSDMKNLPKEVKENIMETEYVHFSISPMRFGLLKAVDMEFIPEFHKIILDRFAKVFEQTYTRFLDLQKAEAQAREAQIEVALERVRARAMAMHKSEELGEAAELLYEELRKLGLSNFINCGYLEIDEENNCQYGWMTNSEGKSMEKFNLPLVGEPILQMRYDAWLRKEPVFCQTVGGDELKKHLAFVNPQLGSEEVLEHVKNFFHDPTIFYSGNFAHGYLSYITGNHLTPDEEALLARFTQVFDMTYKRFLDLQKAEAQAREAEIQLALERVRARTMAMQKSDELSEVASIMFQKIQELGTKQWTSGFEIWEPDQISSTAWVALPDGSLADPMTIPFNEDPYFKTILKARQSGQTFLVFESSGKSLENTYKYMSAFSSPKKFFEESENLGFQIPTFQITHCVFFSFGFLIFITYEPVPEMWDILKRFAKVFEQTYTRFLDLEKAEAQAREAQIEAALERVRARAMAMRSSDELKEVALELRKQMANLGQKELEVCAIHLYEEGENYFESWGALRAPDDQTKLYQGMVKFPKSGIEIVDEMMAHYHAGDKNYVLVNEGEKAKEWLGVMKEYSPQSYAMLEKMIGNANLNHLKAYWAISDFKGGALVMVTHTEPDESSRNLLHRSATVFQLAYRRYLDLQKAEAQAREAQIETALEKVRSRTMAMQKSQELAEVSLTLFEQVEQLGIKTWSTGFNVWSEDDTSYIDWVVNSASGKFIEPYKVDLTSHPSFLEIIRAKKQGDDFFVLETEGETLEEVYRLLFQMAKTQFDDIVKAGFQLPEHQINHYVFGSKVSLMFITFDPCPEAHDIFKRFGKVFEQTYTRFLDLQKAEAQAQEAKIEAALERVRSSMMAMHKSDELRIVVGSVFTQLQTLGFDSEACAVIIYNSDYTAEHWLTGFTHDTYPRSYKLPYVDNPYCTDFIDAWKKGVPFQEFFMEGQAKVDYANWMLENSEFKYLPDEFKKEMVNPKRLNFSDAFMRYGMIEVMGGTPLPVEKISVLKRFANVFEQTYTRFLDLQKAEAQAREAQIEVALERVRARAMAMHSSDELIEVANVMHEQMGLLQQSQLEAFAIHLYPDQGELFETWVAHKTPNESKDQVLTTALTFSKKETQLARQFNKLFREKPKEYQMYVHGELLNEWNRMVISASPEFKKAWGEDMPDSQYWFFSDFSGGTFILIARDEPSKESKELTRRASSVFDLAYRRFLDLQKAEAQAREAEIELALERVRAKSMEMHHSADLKEVVAVLYEQINRLKIAAWGSGIIIFNEPENYQELWLSTDDKDVHPSSYKIHGQEHRHIKELWRIWKKQLENQHIDLVGQIKEDYDNYVFAKTELKHLPTVTIKAIRSLPDSYVSFAWMKCGLLALYDATSSLSSASFVVMRRFAKVFDQAYTRFLDLQKAEAQAREAQIEAALERVRSRSMAMHQTNELNEVSMVLYEELIKLEFQFISCGFEIVLEEEQVLNVWNHDFNQGQLSHFQMPLKGDNTLKERYEAWKSRKAIFLQELQGIALNKHLRLGAPENVKREEDLVSFFNFPDPAYFCFANFSKGCLHVIGNSQIQIDYQKILIRFATVFDQAYTRFLDLQKAEAQAREAQIETALERVRSRSMAMHYSEELSEVASVLYKEFFNLGISEFVTCGFMIYDESKKIQRAWITQSDGSLLESFNLPLDADIVFRERYEAWKRKELMFHQQISGKTRTHHIGLAINESDSITANEMAANFPDPLIFYNANFSQGYLSLISGIPLSLESQSTLSRFAKVFEQTYTRFLDLQKAEMQAREAEIELALERIRARTMALQKSSELGEVIAVVFEQLTALGFTSEGCDIILYDKEKFDALYWFAGFEKGSDPKSYLVPYHEHSYFQSQLNGWKSGEKYLSFKFEGELKKSFDDHVFSKTGFKDFPESRKEKLRSTEFAFIHDAFMSHGIIETIDMKPISDESATVLQRIANVFDQTYTRFLDLQKAEALAREAQIEAALERVRSRSMAMQHSSELNLILAKVFEELTNLELQMERAVIWIYYPENRSVRWWAANPEADSGTDSFLITNQNHPVYLEYWRLWEERRTKHLYILEGDNMSSWCDVLFYEMELGRYPKEVQDAMREPERVYLYNTFNDFGVLFISCLEPLSDDKFTILERFGKVFDQSYTRFEDIQKAEAQAREAIKQSSLDRVRGEIASMRDAKDLELITPLVWTELKSLGVPFFRCGVMLFDEAEEILDFYLSNPDGKALAALHLDFDNSEITRNGVANWRKKKTYIEHWNQNQFLAFMKNLIEDGQVKDVNTYQGGETAPQALTLQFVPFTQGMLYVGSLLELSAEELDLVKALGESLSVAYARYEDFTKLDLAKAKAEKALNDLKAAQEQLVQQEKLASLGQLTAGIAHEIKNPLNFVNNFSDLSRELIEEVFAELENLEASAIKEEIIAILQDVQVNLTKVHEHGTRADSIVTSMLQHSRASGSKREAKAFNPLVKEFVNLSYHGMRAGKAPINVDIDLQLDPKVGDVTLISEDFSRVILNLCNNAFDAMRDKLKTGQSANYTPKLTVKTYLENGKVIFSLGDNGPGIPAEIKDKILQPFFTTKKGTEGTGLGLSITNDIIKAHGGELKVETKEGEGSEFILKLPLL